MTKTLTTLLISALIASCSGRATTSDGGGDPGVTTLVQRIPSADATVVVLLNMEGPAGAARDLLVEAVLHG